MQTQYDVEVLQTVVDDLYAQARVIVVSTASLYALIGLAVGFVFGEFIAHQAHDSSVVTVAVVVFGGIATAIGVASGKKKAFELKFKAQQLLCQMQIEKNTRGKASSLAATAGQ